MRYGSICSGIEAATVAWHPLGWKPAFFSEIEKFPRSVLQHHFPTVPLHGDFTTIRGDEYGSVDLLVGGTPCQDFSVAGKREGLDGARGNLTLEYARLIGRYRPLWFAWENVAGAFSTNHGRDFGAVLACFAGYPEGSQFAPPADGWENSGIVPPAGPDCYGLAWRVLDAQHFGVPQRRRRIILVGYLGDWRPAAAVLLEPDSFERDFAPGRKSKEEVAPTISARPTGGGGLGTDFNCDGGLIASNAEGADGLPFLTRSNIGKTVNNQTPLIASAVMPTLRAGGNKTGGDRPPGTDVDTADSLVVVTAFRGAGQDGFEPSAVAPPLSASDGGGTGMPTIAFSAKDHGQDAGDIAPTLRGMSERGGHQNGGGQVAVAFSIMPMNSSKDYKARETDVAQPIMAAGPTGGNQGGDFIVQPLAFPTEMSGTQYASTEDTSPALAAKHTTAVSFQTRMARNGRGQPSDIVPALNGADAGATSDMRPCVATASVVRRLTPRECERLQGFMDDFTRIPDRLFKRKPATKHFQRFPDLYGENPDGTWTRYAADGPRYKALGNSMAVPVMRWLGERIEAVDQLLREL